MVLPLSATDKGSWEIYTSYNDITEIEPAGNQVFALASNGLFSYHIKNGSVTTYDKAKADANKNNEESNKLLVAIALKELASDRNIQHDDSSRDAMFEAIKPIDNVVKDEDSIGIGSLSLTDLERPKDE
jgi:hypothetical protein